jgi:hypothetical protein
MFTKTILSAWIAAGLMLSAQTAEAQPAPAKAANTLAAQRLAVRPARGGQPDEPPDWEPLIGALSC